MCNTKSSHIRNTETVNEGKNSIILNPQKGSSCSTIEKDSYLVLVITVVVIKAITIRFLLFKFFFFNTLSLRIETVPACTLVKKYCT
jgi:hypothetical protein